MAKKKARRYEDGGEIESDVQRYSGTDEDAMATAKARMAERDAEYAAKQAAMPKAAPVRKAAPKPALSKAPYAEDAPAKNPSVKAARVSDSDIARAKSMASPAGMSRADVSGSDLSVPRSKRTPAMKKGGSVKKFAKGGGIEQRGKTRGRMV